MAAVGTAGAAVCGACGVHCGRCNGQGFLARLRCKLRSHWPAPMLLRHAGGAHIARVRTAMGPGSFTALCSRRHRLAHPVCRDSSAHTGVYYRCCRAYVLLALCCGGLRRTVCGQRPHHLAAGRHGRSRAREWPQVHRSAAAGQSARPARILVPPQVAMLANRRNSNHSPRFEGSIMSTTNGGPAQPHRRQSLPPQLNVVAQYIKDLSFENPNAPQSLGGGQQPQIAIQINVNAKPLQGNDVEVEAQARGQGRDRRQPDVPLRTRLCRRVPPPERAAGSAKPDCADRMPAAAISLRARNHRRHRAQRRLPAAAARPGRFRRPLPQETRRDAEPPARHRRRSLKPRSADNQATRPHRRAWR